MTVGPSGLERDAPDRYAWVAARALAGRPVVLVHDLRYTDQAHGVSGR